MKRRRVPPLFVRAEDLRRASMVSEYLEAAGWVFREDLARPGGVLPVADELRPRPLTLRFADPAGLYEPIEDRRRRRGWKYGLIGYVRREDAENAGVLGEC